MVDITLQWLCLITFVLGSVGNIFLFIIYSRESLKKLSISIYFRVVAINNIFIGFNSLDLFLNKKFNLEIFDQSQFLCKLSYILNYPLGPISTWIEVIVSFDRLFKIIWPTKFPFLFKSNFQIALMTFIILANISYYIVFIFHSNLLITDNLVNLLNNSDVNNETTLKSCSLVQSELDLLNWMDLGNILVAFVSMSFASIVTIVFIFRSRSRLHGRPTSLHHNRDLRFAITTISLNLFFLSTNAPYSLYYTIFYRLSFISNDKNYYYLENKDFANLLTTLIWCFYYCFSFYLQLIVNTIVRGEFFKLLNVINVTSLSRSISSNKK